MTDLSQERASKSVKNLPYLISIPRLTPSNNKLLRMHWRKQRQLRRTFGAELMAATDWRAPVPKVKDKEKRRVKIVSYRVQLIKDSGNFHGGLKPLEDAMIDRQLIYDDSDEFMQIERSQIRVKHKVDEKTDIFIYVD